MAFFDDFDRAAGGIGANYESPTRNVSNGDVATVIASPGIISPASIGSSSFIYTGETFTANQYSEITIADDIFTGDGVYSVYFDDYGYASPMINVAPQASGSNQRIQFWFLTYGYSPGSPSYLANEVYFTLSVIDPAGFLAAQDGATFDMNTIFDQDSSDPGSFIPAQTRLRVERVGNKVNAFIYSPDRDIWYLVGQLDDPAIGTAMVVDGYPGCQVYANGDNTDDAQATNFQAGQDGDTFLTDIMLTEDQSFFLRRRKIARLKQHSRRR